MQQRSASDFNWRPPRWSSIASTSIKIACWDKIRYAFLLHSVPEKHTCPGARSSGPSYFLATIPLSKNGFLRRSGCDFSAHPTDSAIPSLLLSLPSTMGHQVLTPIIQGAQIEISFCWKCCLPVLRGCHMLPSELTAALTAPMISNNVTLHERTHGTWWPGRDGSRILLACSTHAFAKFHPSPNCREQCKTRPGPDPLPKWVSTQHGLQALPCWSSQSVVLSPAQSVLIQTPTQMDSLPWKDS